MTDQSSDIHPVNESARYPDPLSAEGLALERAPRDGQPQESELLTFADLTLADVVEQALRAPRLTWQRLWDTVNAADGGDSAPLPAVEVEAVSGVDVRPALFNLEMLLPTGLMIAGLFFGLLGSSVMAAGINRTEARELHDGTPWLVLGFILWIVAGAVFSRSGIRSWMYSWIERRTSPAAETPETAPDDQVEMLIERHKQQRDNTHSLVEWVGTQSSRLSMAGLGVVLSLGAYLFNGNNLFSPIGVLTWIASIVAWLVALAPDDAGVKRWASERQAVWRRLFSSELRVRFSWTVLALIGIMLIGGYFRFTRFDAVPPEMTSDHVEKLLDAQRVLDGTTQVFFPNNGGREAMQMYLVAIFSLISGLGMQFATLKWVSVLEGLLTIPLLWWMGREIIGDEQPRLGNVVGILLAALVAVSYWHVALSRLSLRIVLTPLIMSLVTVYLVRGMRWNRRADFLKAGLVLGIGVYCYQAVRMIPLVVLAGVTLAFWFRTRDWAQRRRYLLNLAALILISVVIFVPLGRFMIEYPNLFWMRTAGRFFGDDVITTTDPETGVITERNATLEDRFTAFKENLPQLSANIRNVLLMFNWKGDVAWINGSPNRPALDMITGTLFVLGLAAWLVRMVRRRDVVDWLIVPALFIMLMPSALSVAFPVENPSATRTSGSLPFVYLLAAYALALLLLRFEQTMRDKSARYISIFVALLVVFGAYSVNSGMYFGEYVSRYRVAAQPYHLTGRVLRGFAESNGSYGNAFMVAYPYWFDHRAIGIEGGRIDWPNGLVTLEDFPQQISDNMGTPYAFDPGRSVLFFYNANDTETPDVLKTWFPDGMSILQPADMRVKDFYTFIAPPPGEEWLEDFLAANQGAIQSAH